jgi:hypothetical protein
VDSLSRGGRPEARESRKKEEGNLSFADFLKETEEASVPEDYPGVVS